MQQNQFIYSFTYDRAESDLCKLESKYLFSKIEKNKVLLSDRKIEPSCSAFLKNRIDISSFSGDYATLLQEIKKENIGIEGFKVEYVVFEGDTTEYSERLKKLKDVGFCIDGFPDYYSPTITYALCYYEKKWYFGKLIKDHFEWQKHKQKPCSFSNSISINIAKALVNMAAEGNIEMKLLDACCGVGTILLEACFAGYSIEGCEINGNTSVNAQKNLRHFNYEAKVYHSDIKDLKETYDAAILDLPYNLYSRATEAEISNIIESTAKLTNRMVIVSATDISEVILKTGFSILDACSVNKRGKVNFTRKIWVCEKLA